jgi:hypothetical protein
MVTLLTVAATSFAAPAEDAPFTEGSVYDITFIRAKPGGEDAYMKFLATTWKPLQEQAKSDGLIVSYKVIGSMAANKDDWNFALIVEYKNMAALDGLETKERALIQKMAGSMDKANEAAAKRGEIREILGSKLCREIILK